MKTHFGYDAALPLRERADRAVYLVRDPIDVMMSVWDFFHLLGDPSLLNAPQAAKDQIFRSFVRRWVTSGGDQIGFAGTWAGNVSSWIDQPDFPVLVVRYEILKAAPVAQLARVCEFLGEQVAPERLEQAARLSSVDEMRKQEQREIDTKQAGAFYRPMLEKGYESGFRFVGRLNANSYATMLTDEERQEADRRFGPVLARVAQLCG